MKGSEFLWSVEMPVNQALAMEADGFDVHWLMPSSQPPSRDPRTERKALSVALNYGAYIALPFAWWWPAEAFGAFMAASLIGRHLEASILRKERDEARAAIRNRQQEP
ncbi:hypothetical protein [Leisingera sp. M658]|uniref:hypothetical protein n=1 Tax=Leisingera sp. M658 TaxID=2867015 RepID=UPI0021A2E64C|nr:hypothetical protein [Leisingera sp. M658]UWQ76807.1 hypothetical protein K3724_10415 [Leisingera sp. M658]